MFQTGLGNQKIVKLRESYGSGMSTKSRESTYAAEKIAEKIQIANEGLAA